MRRILHIDMNAFFAAIELLRHPELVGKPVVVGGRGDPAERGVVSTADYEARKFGIRSAMPLRTAYRLCPKAVFLPVDYPAYVRIAKRIKALLHEFSPVVEEGGIDEAYLDVTSLPQSAEEIAGTLKARIRKETGLTCSVGIGPNRLLAKIASDLEKPDGLTVLTAGDVEGRLWLLPVRRLPGVGPKTEARLAKMGVATVGELAAIPLEALITLFGPAHGGWLFRAARGQDDSPLLPHREPKSISREITFQVDVADPHALASVLASLVREATAKLRRDDWRCRSVTVKVRYLDFETHTHGLTLARATDSLGVLHRAAGQCLKRFDLAKKVRLVGVRLSALERVTQRHKHR